MLRTRLDKQTEVTLNAAVASLAFPAANTDGASISASETNPSSPAQAGAWHPPGGAHVDAALFIASSVAMTLSGGVGLYGFRADKGIWYLVGPLNGGTPIATLGANTGFSTVVESVGIFDRLAVGPLTAAAVTPSAGTVTISACQIVQAGRP